MPKKKEIKKEKEKKEKLKKLKEESSESEEKSEELKEEEEETFHIDLDLSEEAPSEQGLEELTETPEISETETAEFSEFMIPETSEMPTLTLPSSPIPTTNENLEESTSAADSIGTTSIATGTAGPIREGGSRNLYSGIDYGDYFGKSYAETNYKSREEEIRNLIKQNIAEKPIMPTIPIIKRLEDERIQQANVEDWGREEKEIRDYTIESIAKKEARKRKMID